VANLLLLTCSISYLLFSVWIYGTLNKIIITITNRNSCQVVNDKEQEYINP